MPIILGGPQGLSKEGIDVLFAVLDKVLGPNGDVWGWYPNTDRTDKDGNLKYAEFVFCKCTEDNRTEYLGYGEKVNIDARLEIISTKIRSLTATARASICVRNLKASPPVYGGACAGNPEPDGTVWVYAGSGAPEIPDHLLMCQLQLLCGRITQTDYEELTDLEYPGIRMAMTEKEMNAGTYMAMKAGIESRFRDAIAKVAT